MTRAAVVFGVCAVALVFAGDLRASAATPGTAHQIGTRIATPKGREGPPLPYGRPTIVDRRQRDKAYDLVGGLWKCVTFGGTPFSHQYSRGEDAASLIVATDVKIGGKAYTLKERYQYHRQTKTWSVSLAGGQFAATAGPWNGSAWVFTGIDSEDGRTSPATMTYDFISSNTFRRTFAHNAADGKKTYTGERCVRAV